MTISSHLPDIIDNYISARLQRLAKEAEAATIKELEDDLKKTIIAKFREGDIKALGAANGLVKLQEKEEPVAEDWPAIWEHIKATGQFELLHRRIATLAVKEHWDAGEVIPGIRKTTVYNLTVSKK